MTNRLEQLSKTLELCNKRIRESKILITNKISDILHDRVLDHFESARLTRCQINEGFRNNIEINFEIGFINENGEIDFGSDMNFEYDNVKNRLAVNHGTCGYFTIDNKYQVERIKLLNYIFQYIIEIESHLKYICDNDTETWLKYLNEYYQLTIEINDVKKSIEEDKVKTITDGLKVGHSYMYTEESPCSIRIHYRALKPLTITKLTPKYVYYKANMDNPYATEYRVKKDVWVSHIGREFLISVKE